MDKNIAPADWSLIQCFLAVAETGSLSAAARELGRSQPTLGRQIQALEHSLGASLFTRHARGLQLSDTGAELLPMAREMNAAMHALSLAAAGQAQALEGTVRITASVFASHHLLPPILARIRAEEPAIDLVLLPSDQPGNLLFREADIAVRMFRPTQMDIVARHITTIQLGVFAATSYLDRAGRPDSLDALMEADIVGYDTSDLIVRTMREMGWPVTLDDFASRFHLTRREMEIATHLLSGGNLSRSAERMKISVPTARQYVKSVFAKTGTHGQAELVALLARNMNK